jgi:hypothetical protein
MEMKLTLCDVESEFVYIRVVLKHPASKVLSTSV